MNKTLQNISCDEIRQNWNIHKDICITNTPFYDIIWNDWENKYNDSITNIFYPILKKYISGHNIDIINPFEKEYNIIQEDNSLILIGLTNKMRKDVHILCDNIGLHHESIQKKDQRHIYIYI
jgi:hypothetical protein